MNKMQRRHIAMALTLSCLLPTFAQAESLKDIYLQALENDHEYLAAQASLKANKEISKQGRAALLPNISASANYSSTETTRQGDKSKTWQHSRGISLRQPLFNMKAWYGYKQLKAVKQKAVLGFMEEQQTLILRTSTAYFDALKAVDTLATSKAEEKALSHQLEQTKQRFEVGLTAITEVHEAQAAYDSARANRLLAQGSVGIAFEAIEVLTGRPAQTLTPLQDSFVADGPNPSARSEWESMALEQNRSLQIAKLEEQSKKYNYKVNRSEHLPTVTGEASYGRSERGGDGVAFVIPGESFRTGVSVSLPLFAGGGTSSSRRQAKAEHLQATELRKKTRRDVLQQVRSQHLQLVTAVATIKARKQTIVSSKSALEATQAGYDVGTRDLVDVLNAQRNLFTAEQNYLDTLYNYILSALTLKQIAGQLSIADIDNLNSWLDQSRKVGVQL